VCDYSLMGVPNRLAKEGEELVVYTFDTGSKGLTSAREIAPQKRRAKSALWEELKNIFRARTLRAVHSVPAVCIPPGARLVVRDIPLAIQSAVGVGSVESVVFTQLDIAENRHRDAVRFASGSAILLQRLSDGQRVKVVSLGFDAANELTRDNYTQEVPF